MSRSYAARSGAGAYQQEQFEEGRRAWRKRVMPRLTWTLLPGAAVCIVYELLRPSTVHFLAGLFAGGLFCCYLWARDYVPEHVQRHADGAEGERSTAKALAPLLTDGWHVAHDIDTGRGNRDHVLVGPAGVFLLDSKRLGGAVSVEGDTVRVERVDDPRDSYELPRLASYMRGEAVRLHDEILRDTRVRTWVTAVVVIWSRFDERIVEGNKVVFVHGDELVGWLRARPRRHTDPTTSRIGEHIGEATGRT